MFVVLFRKWQGVQHEGQRQEGCFKDALSKKMNRPSHLTWPSNLKRGKLSFQINNIIYLFRCWDFGSLGACMQHTMEVKRSLIP
jgi:hypothetical protein